MEAAVQRGQHMMAVLAVVLVEQTQVTPLEFKKILEVVLVTAMTVAQVGVVWLQAVAAAQAQLEAMAQAQLVE